MAASNTRFTQNSLGQSKTPIDSDHGIYRDRKFIGLFGGVAAAWSVVAYAQGSATMPTTSGTTTSLPQIEVARVKPVDQMPPNVRLSDDLIDLMKGFSLSDFSMAVRPSCSRLTSMHFCWA
jgi:hypothetical protein